MPFGKLNVISLGERGRGRFETIIPVEANISHNDFVDYSTTKTGRIKITKSTESVNWLARINCRGIYTRGTCGNAFVHNQCKDNVTVLASGHGAEGNAGRISYWEDFLLAIRDNTLIKVKPHGGHKSPPYYLFFSETDVLKMNEGEARVWSDNYEYQDYPINEDLFEKLEPNHLNDE